MPADSFLAKWERIIKGEAPTPERREVVLEALKAMSAEERLDLFHEFCLHCGDVQTDPQCQCWNDE